jgi:hypothetical protein
MRARLTLARLSFVVMTQLSGAQMRSSTGPMGQPPSSFPVALGHTVSFSQPAHAGSFNSGASFRGATVFLADYSAEPIAVPTTPPQIFIVQPAATAEAPPEKRAEPLLIELQGNRYVRFGGEQSGERGVNVPPDFAGAEKPSQHTAQTELTPAVLIFRDGHREQVREYAIVSGVLYANENFWQNGHWTKNIQLAALDIPLTAQANRENGVRFTVPAGPNEVVTRP